MRKFKTSIEISIYILHLLAFAAIVFWRKKKGFVKATKKVREAGFS